MLLIADSGGTKTHWVLGGSADALLHLNTSGINPNINTREEINAVIQQELLPQVAKYLLPEKVTHVYFYGAGCGTLANQGSMTEILVAAFEQAAVKVEHDMLAAARALCGRNKGIACILGTGSNSCLYDGQHIVHNHPSLGYVLGDEGSGSYMGKQLLQQWAYGKLDELLMKKFNERYQLSLADVIHNTYREPTPNKFIASFTYFIKENYQHMAMQNLVYHALEDFFANHVNAYKVSHDTHLYFTGSVASVFDEALMAVAKQFDYEHVRIIPSPMDGLIQYHF